MRRLVLVATALAAASLAVAAPREPSPGALANAIDRIVERPAFAPAFWGIEVRSLRSGKVLYARNAGKNFKPASTLKLVTTAAALDAFGPDVRPRTTVETAGRLDVHGRILGDVFLVGRGDPNLSGRLNGGRATEAFEKLADGLAAAGVARIEGRIVGHEGLFGGDRRGDDWAWDDLVWSYGAEVSALSFNDNSADLKLVAGERVGDPVLLDRSPVSSYYQVVSSATTSPAGAKQDLVLVRDLGSNRILLSGTYPAGAPPWEGSVALEDPARYAATVFSEVLAAKGIIVSGPVATSTQPLPGGLRTLAAYDGAPMSEILKGVNKPSQNLHAEMLLRLLGSRNGAPGTVASGQQAVADFLRKIGVGSAVWALRDGSGLSRSDVLTPDGLVDLLVAMDRHRHAAVFRASLPVAGVDGTLETRMRGTPAERRIVAKTGTLRHANALAGYATTTSGGRLAFAVVVNHHTVEGRVALAAIDEICVALVK
jgi:D-alanyl-D-alanine carboxypeptidase/D-alanyl-D-alanine-endopeptidase (penicillin-binding protein 4)